MQNTFIEEAEFGLKYIGPHIERLAEGAHVLEIGAGPCILISEFCERFRGQKFQAIEPVAPGFNQFEAFIATLKGDYAFNLFQGSYQAFESHQKFDLIYLVNAFEHLPDYTGMLKFAKNHLTQNGRLVILSPNYGFPYESHFQIPILFTPSITRRVFQRRIESFERDFDAHGLWDGLNFVTWPKVQKACRDIGLSVSFDPNVTADMIARLDSDPAFRERQGVLAIPAKLAKAAGLLSLLSRPAMYRFHPYMLLELTHAA